MLRLPTPKDIEPFLKQCRKAGKCRVNRVFNDKFGRKPIRYGRKIYPTVTGLMSELHIDHKKVAKMLADGSAEYV